VVPIWISLIGGCCLQGSYWTKGFYWLTSKVLRSPPWLGWLLWNICVTNDHGYVQLVVNTFRSFPHSLLVTGDVTRLTQQVPLVEQELLVLPECSLPVFSGVCVTRSLILCVCFVDRCLSCCPFYFWSLCCLSCFVLRILHILINSSAVSMSDATLVRLQMCILAIKIYQMDP
jgi:hypothetical protein